MNQYVTDSTCDNISKIVEEHGEEIDKEFRAVLDRFGIVVRASRYSAERWKCTFEGATVPCSLLSWVFDPMPGTEGP